MARPQPLLPGNREMLKAYLIACVRNESLAMLRSEGRRDARELKAARLAPVTAVDPPVVDPVETQRLQAALAPASGGTADGAHARVLWKQDARRDRAGAERSARHDQEPHLDGDAQVADGTGKRRREPLVTEHLGEDAELYPLGILDDDAARKVERHIAFARECAERVAQAQAVAASLAAALPLATPSPALERRLRESARPQPRAKRVRTFFALPLRQRSHWLFSAFGWQTLVLRATTGGRRRRARNHGPQPFQPRLDAPGVRESRRSEDSLRARRLVDLHHRR